MSNRYDLYDKTNKTFADLAELCDYLNATAERTAVPDMPESYDQNEFEHALSADGLDICELPTFAAWTVDREERIEREGPRGPIWSWDVTHVIVGESAPFMLVEAP